MKRDVEGNKRKDEKYEKYEKYEKDEKIRENKRKE
jgi:hypothetical protein